MRDLRLATDDELLRLTRQHPEAFDEFYVRHERLVVAYFRRRTPTPEAAVDLTAETFVAALESVGRFRPGGQPAVAWLLGIANKKLLRSLRKGRIEDRARRRLGAPPAVYDDAELAQVDTLGALSADALLSVLPDEQAAAIRARVLEEQPYDAIARELRCSELVVRKRVSRGLRTLRNVVQEES